MSAPEPEPKADFGPIVPKWMITVLTIFLAAYSAMVLATGEPTFLVPVAIPLVLVLATRWPTAAWPRGSSIETVRWRTPSATPTTRPLHAPRTGLRDAAR